MRLLLDAEQTDVAAGELVFISPMKTFRIWPKISRQVVSLLCLRSEYVRTLATKVGYVLDGELFFLRTCLEDFYIGRLLSDCIDEARLKRPGYRLATDALITLLALQVCRRNLRVRLNPQIEFSRVGPVDRRLRRAVEYIHAHYENNLSLAEIAAEAFLSEYHFARLFKRVFGTSPHAYLAAVRIEQARKLLATSDLAIVDIALRVGYSSQSHFTKLFREQTGFTPAEYRMLSRGRE
ncbi:MAG: AraC family transcriptional regulator [Acidobacteriota bacterium]|nr:AraC family transcriptional regulator [Blastocatellia bacterium]MDW8412584.1 AraC family transcriptional regulator [Acidobacteriota bacterium]